MKSLNQTFNNNINTNNAPKSATTGPLLFLEKKTKRNTDVSHGTCV